VELKTKRGKARPYNTNPKPISKTYPNLIKAGIIGMQNISSAHCRFEFVLEFFNRRLFLFYQGT